MLFPSATVAGLACRVLLIRPEVSEARGRTIEISHRFDTSIGLGRTTIEERRARRAHPLLIQRCTLPLVGNARDDWRKGLAALGNLPVAMPLWVDALPVARWGERVYDAQQVINFHPSTGAFTVYAAADLPGDLGTLTHPLLAPLMLGRWDKRPAASAPAASYAEVEITLAEKRPWSCRVGINPHGSGWTALPDWSSAPILDESVHGLEQTQLDGVAASEPVLDATDTAARWRQEARFKLMSRLAIREALTHFADVKGAWATWPVPAWFQPGADTTATPDEYTARFESDVLTLRYVSGAVATAQAAFLQEIDTGERSQALPSEAFFYQLTYQHDAANPELWTNWDAPVTHSGKTYQPDQCVHKELTASLRPQDAKAELRLGRKPGSLVADWHLGRLFGWVRLEIFAADPANFGATVKQVFGGFVQSVSPDGNVFTLAANFFGTALDREAPSDVFGRRCNTYLTSTRCGLSEVAVKSEGTIAPSDLSADGLTLTLHDVTGYGGDAYAENYFAPNGVLRTGTGRNKMVATITRSVMDGDDLVVTLSRPLWADKISGAGQTVTLIPSCEGQYEADCNVKFGDNRANFRGDPFMPDYLEQSSAAAGMKTKK